MQAKTTSASVTICPAMYGLPADVRIIRDGKVTVSVFNVGHVFTDNANARAYAEEVAAELGVTVAVER